MKMNVLLASGVQQWHYMAFRSTWSDFKAPKIRMHTMRDSAVPNRTGPPGALTIGVDRAVMIYNYNCPR